MQRFTNNETEKAVLSNALTNADSLFELLEHSINVFYDPKNIKIYETIIDLVSKDSPVSINTVQAQSDIKMDYFIELATFNSYAFENRQLLKTLTELSRKRFIFKNTLDLFQQVKSGDADFEQFIKQIQELPEETEDIMSVDISVCNDTSIDILCSEENYVRTGIPYLDNAIIGFFKSHLITIAGKPGGGKTTLALNIASNMKNSLVFSYEMDKEELYIKLLSRYSCVDSMKIETLKLSDTERARIEKAKATIKDLKMTVVDKSLLFPQLISRMTREIKKKKPSVILIDYIQLVEGANGRDDKSRITSMSRILKNFARNNGVPVMILSQLTKDAYKDDSEPTLSSLLGSGSLANNSNTVIFVHDGLIVAKARKARIGKVSGVQFFKETSEFKCMSYNNIAYPEEKQTEWWENGKK